MKIAYKLTLGFLLVVLLVGIDGHLAIRSSQETLEKSIGEGLTAHTTEVLTSVDTEVFQSINVFEEYVNSRSFRAFLINNNNQFRKLNDTQAYIDKQDKAWISSPSETTTPFIRELLENTLSKELREKINFYELKFGYKVIGEVFVTNQFGATVGLTQKTTDYRQDDETWWQQAMLNDLYIYREIERDESAGNIYSIVIAKKIVDENGVFIGVLKIVLNIQRVIDVMANLDHATVPGGYRTRRVSLITGDGKIIYSTDFAFMQNVSNIFPSFIFSEKDGGIFTHQGYAAGEDELAVYVHSKNHYNHKGFGWIMLMEVETSEAFAPVVSLRNQILLNTFIIIALATSFSLYISFSISRAIARLNHATVELGHGNLQARIQEYSNDEIGKLSQSFNKMADDLQESQKKIQKYSSELETKNIQLLEWSKNLELQNNNTVNLNHMMQHLESCQTPDEAYAIITQSCRQLFPTGSGALYIFGNSRNALEAKASWGDTPPQEQAFAPDDCWAIRQGQTFIAGLQSCEMRCAHVKGSMSAYMCVPMMAQGEVIGIMHLTCSHAHDELETENCKNIFTTMTEMAALALANLKLRDSLHSLSIRDPLTGLFNRRYLDETLELETLRAGRNNETLGIIMFDIDHFKRFNDTFGHDAGDIVLQEVGQLMKTEFRGYDISCRYGGEEFLLVLPGSSKDKTLARAESFRETIKHSKLRYRDQPLGVITISLGIAIFPEHGLTCDAVMKAADKALYSAKKAGRDCVVSAKQLEASDMPE